MRCCLLLGRAIGIRHHVLVVTKGSAGDFFSVAVGTPHYDLTKELADIRTACHGTVAELSCRGPVSTGHSVTNINASLVRERSVHGRWPPLTRKRFEACRLGPLGREIGIASDSPPAVVLAQNRECVAHTSNWLAARRRDGHVNVVAQIRPPVEHLELADLARA